MGLGHLKIKKESKAKNVAENLSIIVKDLGKKSTKRLNIVTQAFNLSRWEASTGASLGVWGQPGLHREF